MKKISIIFSLLIIFSLQSTDLSAQGWLKKLGKEIEKAGKKVEKTINDVDKALQTEEQSTDTETAKQETQPTTTVAETPKETTTTTTVADNTPAIPAKPDNVLTELVKGNVKEIVETNICKGITTKNVYTFNTKRQVTSISLNSYDKKASLTINYEFNEDGSLKKRAYSSVGSYDWGDIISIDEEPARIRLKYTSHSETDNETSSYVYKNGQLVKEIVTFGNGNKKEIAYDNSANNETASDFSLDSDDVEKDAKGRLTHLSAGYWTYTYAYNVNGYLSKRELLYRDGDKVITYSGYLYDAKKNWTKRIVKRVTDGYLGDANLTITSTRKITYYTAAELASGSSAASTAPPTPLPVNSLTKLCDRDIMGLKGKVKSVKYSTNTKTISFRTDGFHTSDRRFITAKRFQVGGTNGYTWDISSTTGSLIYKGIEGMSQNFHFDKYRRISKEAEVSYSPHDAEYFYKSNADPFPYKKVVSEYWEEGSATDTYEYEYQATDSKGNWTKRKVKHTSVTEEIDINGENRKKTTSPVKTYIETATITYYPN